MDRFSAAFNSIRRPARKKSREKRASSRSPGRARNTTPTRVPPTPTTQQADIQVHQEAPETEASIRTDQNAPAQGNWPTDTNTELLNILPQVAPETLQDVLNLEPYRGLLNIPAVADTLQNPLGNLFFKQHITGQAALDCKFVPGEETILNFCDTFSAYLKFQREENKKDIHAEALKLITSEKKRQTSRHFTAFSNKCGVKPPDAYSSMPTLNSDARMKTANSIFPKTPFTGKGPPFVQEFLMSMNTAQSLVRLSRSEFQSFLQKGCSGEPYITIAQGLLSGLTVEALYQTLLQQYDNSISPAQAGAKLLSLRASKDMTFAKLTTIAQNLAGRAGAIYTNDDERRNVFNIDASAALKRSLPTYSKTLASETQVQLNHELEEAPTYHQLTGSLMRHVDTIDEDIANNGVPKTYNEDLSLYKRNPNNRDSTAAGSSNRSNNGYQNNGQQSNGHQTKDNNKRDTTKSYKNSQSIKEVSQQQSRQPRDPHHVPLGDSNKKYCALCGQNNHQASDFCKLIRDDQGRQVRTGVSTGYCNPCFRKHNRKLYHSEDLCPGRDRMQQLYREKRVYPAGIFKKAFLEDEENHRDNNGDSHRNNPHGRIQAIKCKPHPGTASVLSVDNSAIQTSDLTAKLYISCQASKLHLPGDFNVTALYDTAADQNIITRSYFGQTFKLPHDDVDSYLDPSEVRLVSYTNHEIPVSGEVTLLVQLHFRGPHQPINFLVVEDITNEVTPMIIGLSGATKLLLALDYDLNLPDPIPYLIDRRRPDKPLDSQYLSDLELKTCKSKNIHLDPGQSKFIPMYLDTYFGVYPNMEVIISEDHLPTFVNGSVKIYPTKSTLHVNRNGQLYGQALVKNNTARPVTDIMPQGYFENAHSYETRDFDFDFESDAPKFIHEIHVLPADPSPLTAKQPDSCLKVNRIRLDLQKLPIYNQHSAKPTRVNILERIFPEQDGYIANPNAINNDTTQPNLALTDIRCSLDDLMETADPDKLRQFEDANKTIQLGLTSIENDEDLTQIVNEPSGYTIPDDEFIKPEDLVILENYPPEIQPYIRDIFIDSYPSVISTHSTDRGNLSTYLGTYTIKLKPGQVLPQHKRLYYLSPPEKLQMQSILEFLLKNNTIERASLTGDTFDNYASPAYLIPKADKNACPRLIVNFQKLNPCLQAEPALLPTAEALIHSLRNKFLFSSSDMANAFHSITLDPSCRDLTLFSTPLGSFRHCSLPTGIKTSPESLSRFMEKILHWKLDYDDSGKLLMDGSVAQMSYDPILECQHIYDDFIIGTELAPTYLESIDVHFKVVKRIIGRIATHKGKISLKKSQLGKSRVNFFGIFISYNFVCVDQRRIQKLLDAPMPTTPKLMRGFLGLLNSLRSYLNFDVLSNSEELTPLTSSKADKTFTPTPAQYAAFERLKAALASGPIFSKIIDVHAPKVVLTDSAGNERGSFSAVLAQIVKPQNNVNILPPGLNFEDNNHQTIYDRRVPVTPLPLQENEETIKEYKKRIADDRPPEYLYLTDPNLGYSSFDVQNSLGITLQLLLDLHSCQTPLKDILKKTSSIIRKTILRDKYIEFIFHNNKTSFNKFIQNLEAGIVNIDKHQLIFDALSQSMHRPLVVISNLPDHTPITEHSADKIKPAFVFLLYKQQDNLIVRPGLVNKHNSFNLSSLRSMFEIVSYATKKISPTMSSLHIIDLELMGVMYALSSFARIIGKNAECVLLTDAKCIYYLFNNDALAASAKLQRWNFKILETLPQLKFSYLKGTDNLADWLSRAYSADLPDQKRLALPRFVKQELDDVLPSYKIFTQDEWKQFVLDNPNYLGYFDAPEKPKLSIRSLSAENRAIGTVLTPLQVLKERLNMENLVKEQKLEYKTIYEACLQSQKQEYTFKKHTYFITDAILFTLVKKEKRILIPTKLLPVFIAYTHLLCTHAGEVRMLLNLQNFFHPDLNKLVRNYCKACFGCQVQNSPTKLERFGLYVTITRPFETVSLDFIQSLPPYRRYNHILTATCQLTGTILIFPMKSLTSREFINVYMFHIHPLYSPTKILCDSATAFLEKQNLIFLASINVQVIYSSSYFSASKGLVESANKQIKWALIKILADHPASNWVQVLPLVARLYNTTKCNKTGYTPLELLFGSRSSLSQDHFGLLPEEHYHPLIQNENVQVAKLNEELTERLATAKTAIDAERTKRISNLNQSRIHKEFQRDDIVLARNFTNTVGVNTALRPIFHTSPHRILEVSPHSSVTQRITDQVIQKFNNNDLKKFTELDNTFDDLPPEILQIIRKPFTQLTDQQMATLALQDTLPLPVPVNRSDPQPLVSPITTPEPIKKSTRPVQDRSAVSDSDTDSDTEEGFFTNAGRRLRNTANRTLRFQQ